MTTMILTSGCFDPLHGGHIEFFRRIRDIWPQPMAIYCAVAPDMEVERLKHRPVLLPALSRAAVVRELVFVTEVSVETLEEAIQRLVPAVIVKGLEWRQELPLCVVELCRNNEIAIMFIDTVHRQSSSKLLREYMNRVAAPERKQTA